MEFIGAIGTIHTIYTIIKAIFKLQKTVVKHKEEVEAFAKFVHKLEKKLESYEVNLEQRSRELTLPRDIVYSLDELLKLLEASKHLLEKLQYRFRITRASRKIRKLREKIDGIRLDIAFDMHFQDKQPVRQHVPYSVSPESSYLPSAPPFPPHPQNSSVPAPSYARHPARRPEFPLFPTAGTPSYYPPDHGGIGWEAYRDRTVPGHPRAVDGRKPDCNRFNASPHFLSRYPTQGTSIWLWKDYQRRCSSQFPGLK